MNKIPSALELSHLYNGGKLSLSEISEKTTFKIHKILYWMDKYGLKRRSRSVANYIKANPLGEPFKIKKKLTRTEVKLKYLALGLYWGEGGKTSEHSVRITNSDPGVIILFLKYLVKICQVSENRIHFYLQTFKDIDVYSAKKHWSSQLSISPDKINTGKPVHSMGGGTYKKISSYGVMSLVFSNTHLKSYIMRELVKLGMK